MVHFSRMVAHVANKTSVGLESVSLLKNNYVFVAMIPTRNRTLRWISTFASTGTTRV